VGHDYLDSWAEASDGDALISVIVHERNVCPDVSCVVKADSHVGFSFAVV
jgi:hypothetical protein